MSEQGEQGRLSIIIWGWLDQEDLHHAVDEPAIPFGSREKNDNRKRPEVTEGEAINVKTFPGTAVNAVERKAAGTSGFIVAVDVNENEQQEGARADSSDCLYSFPRGNVLNLYESFPFIVCRQGP